MRDCTGKEICMEWLYHLGVPENEIEDMAEHLSLIHIWSGLGHRAGAARYFGLCDGADVGFHAEV